MKEIKLQIDGTEITAQVDESELARLIKPERARTGYERVDDGRLCYVIVLNGTDSYFERDRFTNNAFNNGNYVNDEQLCKDRYRARVLHDRMEQWQALNDKPVDWGDRDLVKYIISYDYRHNELCGDSWNDTRFMGVVCFSTEDKANEAIEAFRDELMWYYTEYRSRLEEPKREDGE